MDVKTVGVVLSVFWVLSGCAGREGVVSPDDAPKPASVAKAQDLQLSVAAERSHYFVGEPVYVAITLRNVGQQPARVFGRLQPESGAVDIVVTTPDGKTRTFVPLGEADHGASAFVSLPPGAAIGDVVPVFFGGHGWTFDQPGRYGLVAYYRIPNGKGVVLESESPAIQIDVQPSPEGMQLVGDKKASTETGKFLVWQAGDHLEQGRAKLNALIERYPDSRLTSYAHFALGKSWSDAFADYRKRAVRLPDCERAMQHLSKVRNAQVTDFVRVQRDTAAARCMAREKETVEARRLIGSARKVMQGKPEYNALAMRLDDLEKRLQ